MVYPLLALAVLAAVIILEKVFVFGPRTRLPPALLDLVETYGFAWDELERAARPRSAGATISAASSASSWTIARIRPGGSNPAPPTRRA